VVVDNRLARVPDYTPRERETGRREFLSENL